MSRCRICGGSGASACNECIGSGKRGDDKGKPCNYCRGTGRGRCVPCRGTGRA